MSKIHIPTPLRQYVGKQASVEVKGTTVGEAMNALVAQHPDLKKPAPLVATPFKLSRTPASIRHRAPQLDEHTDELVRQPKTRTPSKAKA